MTVSSKRSNAWTQYICLAELGNVDKDMNLTSDAGISSPAFLEILFFLLFKQKKDYRSGA